MIEGLVHFPSKGIIESIKDLKKDKFCVYCKKKCEDDKWWDIFSFRKYCEIGKDSKTNEWIYVCDKCTKVFVKDFFKQLTNKKVKKK